MHQHLTGSCLKKQVIDAYLEFDIIYRLMTMMAGLKLNNPIRILPQIEWD